MDSRKIKIILGFIGIFLISFGVSYSAVRTNFWGFRTEKGSSLVSPIANTSNSPTKDRGVSTKWSAVFYSTEKVVGEPQAAWRDD